MIDTMMIMHTPPNDSSYSRDRIPPIEVGVHIRGHNCPFVSAHSSKYFASNLHSSVSVTAEHMKRLKQKSSDWRFLHVLETVIEFFTEA